MKIRMRFRWNFREDEIASFRPLDWMENIEPERYSVGGVERTYRWYPETGTFKFIPPEP